MKRFRFVMLAIIMVGMAQIALAEVVMIENFEYDAGQLTTVSGGNWVHNTGTGYFIQVSDGNLSYLNYQQSNIGRCITITSPTASAEDVYRQFPTQNHNTYAAFILNVTDTVGLAPDTSTNGDYFVAFLPPNSTSNYMARLCIKKGQSENTFRLGIRVNGNAANPALWYNSDLETATANLIILGYGIFQGTTNDTAALWINPNIPGSQPDPLVIYGTNGGTDVDSLGRFAIRQNRSTTPPIVATPNAIIDGIAVGNSWESVTGVFSQPFNQTNAKLLLQPLSPNPISKATQIKYSLKESGRINLSIFNILGQQVVTLVDGYQTAGSHTAIWKLNDVKGAMVPNGIYFFKLTANGQTITRRATVIR